MIESIKNENERITIQSKNILNNNGYSFQYSVINELNKVSKLWEFYGAEIPVSTRNRNTQIDFVFQDHPGKVFLIGECKRVHKLFSDWAFVQTPFTSRAIAYNSPLIFEQLREIRGDVLPQVQKEVMNHIKLKDTSIYGLGFRVKNHLQKGEVECQENIDVINKSIEQVLLSTSGFINYLAKVVKPSNFTKYNITSLFLPTIITTAKLWVTDSNISEANLIDGNLTDIEMFKEVPYVWFNFNRSHNFSPDFKKFTYYYNQQGLQAPYDTVMSERSEFGLRGFEFEEFMRSVLILNSSYLTELDMFNELYLGL